MEQKLEQKGYYIYVYDINRANYYMEHNVPCRGTGINPKTKMIWYRFIREETKEAWELWLEESKAYLDK